MKAPDLIGPVIGFRTWRLRRGRLEPWSAVVTDAWKPGANRARCMIYGHSAPEGWCRCGFHAYRTPELLNVEHSLSVQDVVGIVRAWGRLELHVDGFRAEHAVPVFLTGVHFADGYAGVERYAREHGIDTAKPMRRFLWWQRRPTYYEVEPSAIRLLNEVAPRYGQPIPADLWEKRIGEAVAA